MAPRSGPWTGPGPARDEVTEAPADDAMAEWNDFTAAFGLNTAGYPVTPQPALVAFEAYRRGAPLDPGEDHDPLVGAREDEVPVESLRMFRIAASMAEQPK